MLQGCTTWNYDVKSDHVVFEVRSWNHNPLDYVVENADIPSFESIETGYAKDANSVYYKGFKIENADPHTFEILELGYAKDAKRVYLLRCALPSADPGSFTIVAGNWVKDQNQVFYGRTPIPEADPVTFRTIGDCWAIDNQNAYQHIRGFSASCGSEDSLIPVIVFMDVETKTFEEIDCFHARDSTRTYDAL